MNELCPPTLNRFTEDKNLLKIPIPHKAIVFSGSLELMTDDRKLPRIVFQKSNNLNKWHQGVLELKTPAFN